MNHTHKVANKVRKQAHPFPCKFNLVPGFSAYRLQDSRSLSPFSLRVIHVRLFANTWRNLTTPQNHSYRNRGEKSVSLINVESTFSTSVPFSSDFALTLFHSASS